MAYAAGWDGCHWDAPMLLEWTEVDTYGTAVRTEKRVHYGAGLGAWITTYDGDED